jgi:hypothetical protein
VTMHVKHRFELNRRKRAGVGKALQRYLGEQSRLALEAAGETAWTPEQDPFWTGYVYGPLRRLDGFDYAAATPGQLAEGRAICRRFRITSDVITRVVAEFEAMAAGSSKEAPSEAGKPPANNVVPLRGQSDV